MVLEVEIDGYSCPYCQEWYEDESDAEDCIESCLDADSPTEDTQTFYVCECCQKRYEAEIAAIQCEKKHYKEDPGWKISMESKKRLEKAAKHPQQKRLAE